MIFVFFSSILTVSVYKFYYMSQTSEVKSVFKRKSDFEMNLIHDYHFYIIIKIKPISMAQKYINYKQKNEHNSQNRSICD